MFAPSVVRLRLPACFCLVPLGSKLSAYRLGSLLIPARDIVDANVEDLHQCVDILEILISLDCISCGYRLPLLR